MTKKEKSFREFFKKLETAYCQYYVWKTLQNKNFEKIYNKENKVFWVYVISALLFSYSAELAKLTEKQNKRSDKVVSIFHLLEYKLNNSDDTIKKLKKLRNKVLMHNDLKTAVNIQKFLSELKLRYIDIENLIDELVKTTDEIASDFNHSPVYQSRHKNNKDVCEKDTLNLVNQFVQ